MKNKTKLFIGVAAAFVLGVAVNNFAMSDVAAYRVAVVDVPQVVDASSKVQALKKEQQAKAKDLAQFIEKARKDVAGTTDVKKKKTLEEKYTKELNTKREAIEKDYAKKLAETDAAISAQIANVAKANNYDIVISKGVVLYGGSDITAAVKASVK